MALILNFRIERKALNCNLQKVVNIWGSKGTSELIWDHLGDRNVIKVIVRSVMSYKKSLNYLIMVFFWHLFCLSVAAGGRGSYSHWWRQPASLHGPSEKTGSVQRSVSISVPRDERHDIPILTQGSATIFSPCEATPWLSSVCPPLSFVFPQG